MATKLAVAKAAEAQAKADMVTLAKQAAEDKQKELATALAEAKKHEDLEKAGAFSKVR